MTLRPSGAIVAMAVVAAVLTGCTGEKQEPDGHPVEPSPRNAIAKGARYVSLGDSHVSGPELGASLGPAGCFRTTGNYPHVLSNRMDLELTDASCGGATTANLDDRQAVNGGVNDPQLDSVGPEADLVTLGIGANDEGVFGKLILNCSALALRDPDGAPCTDLDKEDGRLPEHAADLQKRVVAGLREIRDRAPEARVVVVGYPQWFPAKGSCDQMPLAPGDYPFARAVNELLNTTLRKAAAEARVEYLSIWEAAEGHDPCSDDPWLAGKTPTAPAAPYHPYAKEPVAVAKLLADLVSHKGAAA